MNNDERRIRQQANWDERKDTLRAVFDRLLETLDRADPYEAVMYTVPIAALLVEAIQAAPYEIASLNADRIINESKNP